MKRLTRTAWKSFGDYFAAFDERANCGSPRDAAPRGESGDAASAFCLAAFVGALGVILSAASATAATPF